MEVAVKLLVLAALGAFVYFIVWPKIKTKLAKKDED